MHLIWSKLGHPQVFGALSFVPCCHSTVVICGFVLVNIDIGRVFISWCIIDILSVIIVNDADILFFIANIVYNVNVFSFYILFVFLLLCW